MGQDRPAKPYTPRVLPASDEAERAIARMRVPEGMRVELVAAEPMLANPVAFTIDERGRFYVAETFRIAAGVEDNRNHMVWLDDELAARSVADRVAMFRKYLGNKADEWTREHERVRLVEDRDGDGKADHSTVFADGFNDLADGIGAGVLARRGDVYFTCIPRLWRLRDRDGDGVADERLSLHDGYGVHVAFFGHDLHGLRLGPDGKLYFSIGDRGLNVKTLDGRHLEAPDTGSVLRCNRDGSGLEIFATGLRNPQELAFDEYGNLFTCDNNSDSGDRARIVHVVEGGDSGWRIGYQYLERPNSRGPWNAEKLWHPPHNGQPAYLNPPIAHLGDGPSGLAYDPGTGLPGRYRGHFFLCDFRGASFQSGVRAFTLKPKGAGFELAAEEKFAWGTLATDVDFAPDGALYITDWSEGWGMPGKGRIYRIFDPAAREASAAAGVKHLLAEGFDKRPAEELARLLEHPDMRVRQEAQFALAERQDADLLTSVLADEGRPRLTRLHALWGLASLHMRRPLSIALVRPLLAGADPELRAQAAKVVGEALVQSAAPRLIELLDDPSPRVRYFSALSLGKLRRRDAILPILAMLRANADADPYLRHAGAFALQAIGDVRAMIMAVSDSQATSSERLAVVVALRRLRDPAVARFLGDAEPRVVDEAARAIYDEPIAVALPELAALVGRAELPGQARYRAIAAAHRLGQREHARAVAEFAAQTGAAESLRVEALGALRDWSNPSGRDRVSGLWRPCERRPADAAASVAAPAIEQILGDAPDRVQHAAAEAAGRLAISTAAPALHKLLADTRRTPRTRAEAMRALERLDDSGLARAAALAVRDRSPTVRIEGRRVLAKLEPAGAIQSLEQALEQSTTDERQSALATLAELNHRDADRVLADWLDRLAAGGVPLEIQLDLLEAAGRRDSPPLRDKLGRFEASRRKDDPLAAYRETLAGGDRQRGMEIFLEKTAVACLRCHKVAGQGGEVGPDLAGIGAKQTREYLLEALVNPNKVIAQGFESLIVATSDGKVHTGVVKEDTSTHLRLITTDGVTITIAKPSIEEQKRGPSAMTEDVTKHLTKRELRDLIEFLAGLK
jgi:quinoprotein glucose dehydrogenase